LQKNVTSQKDTLLVSFPYRILAPASGPLAVYLLATSQLNMRANDMLCCSAVAFVHD